MGEKAFFKKKHTRYLFWVFMSKKTWNLQQKKTKKANNRGFTWSAHNNLGCHGKQTLLLLRGEATNNGCHADLGVLGDGNKVVFHLIDEPIEKWVGRKIVKWKRDKKMRRQWKRSCTTNTQTRKRKAVEYLNRQLSRRRQHQSEQLLSAAIVICEFAQNVRDHGNSKSQCLTRPGLCCTKHVNPVWRKQREKKNVSERMKERGTRRYENKFDINTCLGWPWESQPSKQEKKRSRWN